MDEDFGTVVAARGGFVGDNILDNRYVDCLCYLPVIRMFIFLHHYLLFDTHECRSHLVYEESHAIDLSFLRLFRFIDLIHILKHFTIATQQVVVGIPFRDGLGEGTLNFGALRPNKQSSNRGTQGIVPHLQE